MSKYIVSLGPCRGARRAFMTGQEIPHLMCALGYFPTQLEITNMTNEAAKGPN